MNEKCFCGASLSFLYPPCLAQKAALVIIEDGLRGEEVGWGQLPDYRLPFRAIGNSRGIHQSCTPK